MIGAYLKAFLTRYLGGAWKAATGGGEIVKHVFTHDPEQYVFSITHLPALYIWRPKSARAETLAEDWRVLSDVLKIYWLLPNVQQTQMPAVSRAMPMVGKAIDKAIERGRDPSYIVPGDPDTTAPFEGSVVARHAGVIDWELAPWTTGRIAIRAPGNMRGEWAEVGLFDGLMVELTIRERARDLLGADADHPEFGEYGGSPFAGPAQLVLSVNDGAADAALLLGYTMLYVQGGSTAQVLGTTPAKLTCFTGAGQAVGVIASHADDKVTIQSPGPYNVVGTLSCTGTAGRKVTVRARKNGVVVDGILGELTLDTATRSLSLCGQVPGCAESDVLELYAEADQAATSLTVTSGTLAVTRI